MLLQNTNAEFAIFGAEVGGNSMSSFMNVTLCVVGGPENVKNNTLNGYKTPLGQVCVCVCVCVGVCVPGREREGEREREKESFARSCAECFCVGDGSGGWSF